MIGYHLFTTETAPYAIFVHRPTGNLADFANEAMDADAAWADCAFDETAGRMPQNAYHLGYPIDLSAFTWMAAGVYDVCFYSGASPAISDTRFGKIVIEFFGKEFKVLSESF